MKRLKSSVRILVWLEVAPAAEHHSLAMREDDSPKLGRSNEMKQQ
jgi:hypothetical protein